MRKFALIATTAAALPLFAAAPIMVQNSRARPQNQAQQMPNANALEQNQAQQTANTASDNDRSQPEPRQGPELARRSLRIRRSPAVGMQCRANPISSRATACRSRAVARAVPQPLSPAIRRRPAFDRLRGQIDEIEAAAWAAYSEGRKAPRTRKAGAGFADPDYNVSVDRLAARAAILEAQRGHDNAAAPSHILIVNGSPRSEHTCPGEMSKSWRLVDTARQAFESWALLEALCVEPCRARSGFGGAGRVANAATTLVAAVHAARSGRLVDAGSDLPERRHK